ncbi:MAG: A24 family peptidase [Hyphomicrobiales bacterium]|nr:A24 family peptidase [Hyphomicrobiales bacterium]
MAVAVGIFQIVLWSAAICVLFLCTLQDLRSRIIPDRYVLAIALIGAGLMVSGAESSVWISPVIAFATLVALGFAAHFDVVGGGDAKLIAATAILFPAYTVLPLLAAIVIAGGLLGCSYVLMRYALSCRFTQALASTAAASKSNNHTGLFALERSRIAGGDPMPYALAIFAGVLFTIVSEPPKCFSVIF